VTQEIESLRKAVDAHRDAEKVQTSALQAEVDALEAIQAERVQEQAQTLEEETNRAREAASREARRVGERLILQYRQQVQANLRALREGAQQKYDDAMRSVSDEVRSRFNDRMKELEVKAIEVQSRGSGLRQQIATVAAQVEAVQRVVHQATARRKNLQVQF